jgi:phosphinothricin acetyltransferase
MNPLSIEVSDRVDGSVLSLLDEAALPRPDGSPMTFWKLVEDGTCVGVAGAERWGSVALLRSLTVKYEARRRGLAAQLVRTALTSLQRQDVRNVWLFTETAHDYFLAWGFEDRPRSDLPDIVLSSQEGTKACPASAAVMGLDLTRPVLHIRRALPTDASAIADIYNQGIRGRMATFEAAERTPDERAAWLSERPQRFPVLAALDADRLVGWLSLNPFSPREAYRYVADVSVYVDSRMRRRGVGSRLLEAGIAEARRQGFHKLVLTLFPENHAARALYLHHGFQSVGILREQGLLDGQWRDTEMMDYLLPAQPPASR